jgi:hypothetical protein
MPAAELGDLLAAKRISPKTRFVEADQADLHVQPRWQKHFCFSE